MKFLSDYIKKPQDALLTKLGIFFAFDMETFHKEKDPNVKKYITDGAGMLCPKENWETYKIKRKEIYLAAIEQDKKENSQKNIIERELNNYECVYIGDPTDAIEQLSDYGYSEDDIYKVFNELLASGDSVW